MASPFQETRALPSSARRWERIEQAPRDAGLRSGAASKLVEGTLLGMVVGALLSLYWVSGYQTSFLGTAVTLMSVFAIAGALLYLAGLRRG